MLRMGKNAPAIFSTTAVVAVSSQNLISERSSDIYQQPTDWYMLHKVLALTRITYHEMSSVCGGAGAGTNQHTPNPHPHQPQLKVLR